VNSKGQFNTPLGKYTNPTICDVDNISACSAALTSAELACANYKDATASAQPADFIYFDPPYLPLTATSNFTAYSVGGFGLKEQEELAAYCKDLNKRGVRFLLSNSDTPVIRDMYKDFAIDAVKASRSVNSKASKRGQISELMIKNY
jgi:DNA adenine methylase